MTRRILGSIATSFLLFGAVTPPTLRADPPSETVETAGPAATLEDLRWLVGSWRGQSGDTVQEELWTAAAGGLMLGLHRDVTPGRPAFFEFLRIAESEEGIVYLASPAGREATPFRLIEIGEHSVWFANPEHDFPQRIGYRLEGDDLVARIEGETAKGPRSAEWRWQRVAQTP